MGLDMDLYARKEEYAYSYYKEKGTKFTNKYPKDIIKFFEEFSDSNFEKKSEDDRIWDPRSISRSTSYKIGYWRKANAIHSWFVENCGKGIDKCQEIRVDSEDLEALLKLCREVLADHSKASTLLATHDGFFFGSTEYDEWYFEGIEATVKILEKTLGFLDDREHHKDHNWRIIYQASW